MAKRKLGSKREQSQVLAFNEELCSQMKKNDKLLVLTADLISSCKLSSIVESFPDRFINVGIAEQNMVGIAAGLAHEGYIPFVYSFSVFTSMRSCEQLRTDVFYNDMNVKIVGSHSGLSAGSGGPTHFSIEDIGIVRSMPNSSIISPADAVSARKAVHAVLKHETAVYIRLDRNPIPVIYSDEMTFILGKGIVLKEGSDCVIFATGVMVSIALAVADELYKTYNYKIAVIDIHTIKPIDERIIIEYSSKCIYTITLEEHNIQGGLGSAVAEIISSLGVGCKLKRIGINNYYPKGGPVAEIREKAGLTCNKIAASINDFINYRE
jgi:transketolase